MLAGPAVTGFISWLKISSGSFVREGSELLPIVLRSNERLESDPMETTALRGLILPGSSVVAEMLDCACGCGWPFCAVNSCGKIDGWGCSDNGWGCSDSFSEVEAGAAGGCELVPGEPKKESNISPTVLTSRLVLFDLVLPFAGSSSVSRKWKSD